MNLKGLTHFAPKNMPIILEKSINRPTLHILTITAILLTCNENFLKNFFEGYLKMCIIEKFL